MTTICVDNNGVWRQEASSPRMGIRWDEIYAISAYRLDGGDETLTVVELDYDFGECIELHSDCPGFDAAIDVIGSRLVGADANWRKRLDSLGPDDDPVALWSRESAR